jgi:hypothetical protein
MFMSATILLIYLIYQLYRLFALQIAKNFIQPNMKEKVKFVYASKPESMKIIEDLFDIDTLETSFGGRSTSTAFDINKYAERMRRADKMREASENVNGYD